jgi:hypothetical protein
VIGTTVLSRARKAAVFSRSMRRIISLYWMCSYPAARIGGQQAKQVFSPSGKQRVRHVSFIIAVSNLQAVYAGGVEIS